MAKAFDAELHIVTAYKPIRGAKIVGAPEGAAKVWAPMPDQDAERIRDEAAASARAAGVKSESHLLRKEPADALLEVAADVKATLLVVGSKGMSGARRVLGSVPNKISHGAHCNVLIVATDSADAG